MTKNNQAGWERFEALESEPRHKQNFDMSVEDIEALLDSGYFLKHRVWRSLKKVRGDMKPQQQKFHRPRGFYLTLHHPI